jgi:RsiW-degrading membrane proteinase PrsW (M82 family)
VPRKTNKNKSDNRKGAKAKKKAAKNFWFGFLCAFAVAVVFDSPFLGVLGVLTV